MSRLAYRPTTGPELRIDLLLGAAVVVMFIDHLAGHSLVQTRTPGVIYRMSAAEACVFMAGFIAAVDYGRQSSVHRVRTMCLRLLMRAVHA